jgi:hypothetical protein
MAEEAEVITQTSQSEAVAPQKSVMEINAESRGMTKDQLEHLAFGTPLPAAPVGNIVDNGEGAGGAESAAAEGGILDKGTVDYNAYVKEQFGYETVEEAKTQFAELKKLAETGSKSEPTFADETSKKIYNNILKGNLKEVKSFLEAKEVVDTLDTLLPEQKLKMFIKMQYPMYKTDALLDAKFNKTYAVDSTPYMDGDDIIDPVGLDLAKAEAAQKMQDDLQKADEYFTQYKGKISLPDITADKPQIDEDYEAYKARNAKANDDYQNKVLPVIESLKEDDVKFNFKVDDSKNQMNFDLGFKPTKEDFEATKNEARDFMGFIQKTFFDKDGNLDAEKLAKTILLTNNSDKFVQSIGRQAVNAERKRVLAQAAPNGNGIAKDHTVANVGIKTDFQKRMDHALSI